MSITDGELLEVLKTVFNSLRVSSIQEEEFILGNVYSYEDYSIYDNDGASVKYLYFDVSAFTKNNLVVLPPAFSSTSGPVTVEFFANPTVTAPGTILGVSNRRGTSENVNQAILSQPLVASVTSPGTRFSGRLIPASGVNPNQASGAEGSSNLPFELDTSVNYLIKITNTDGLNVYVQTDFTWIES